MTGAKPLEPIAAPTARAVCPRCERAQSACICHWITPTLHAVEVLILQHPLEVSNAKGSARLLHWSLPGSQLAVGEAFEETALRALLAGEQKQALLLYPDTPHDAALGLIQPPVVMPNLLRQPARLRLVVLDGTWRKSRKMLYCNPLLQQLPRLALRGMPPSHYRVRKAHLPDQLSTLEATCAALAQLDAAASSTETFAPLLAAFDGFVAQQMGYRTRSTYQSPPT